jgi:hypothetical protein
MPGDLTPRSAQMMLRRCMPRGVRLSSDVSCALAWGASSWPGGSHRTIRQSPIPNSTPVQRSLMWPGSLRLSPSTLPCRPPTGTRYAPDVERQGWTPSTRPSARVAGSWAHDGRLGRSGPTASVVRLAFRLLATVVISRQRVATTNAEGGPGLPPGTATRTESHGVLWSRAPWFP